MGKIILILILMFQYLWGTQDILEKKCLSCHKTQQIPSHLIYKRYLLKYSTKRDIEKAIYHYLKDPKKEHSIMPLAFFLKFPMKEKTAYDDKMLKEMISAYIEHFDLRKKLRIQR